MRGRYWSGLYRNHRWNFFHCHLRTTWDIGIGTEDMYFARQLICTPARLMLSRMSGRAMREPRRKSRSRIRWDSEHSPQLRMKVCHVVH